MNDEALFGTITEDTLSEIESDGIDLFGVNNHDYDELDCEEVTYDNTRVEEEDNNEDENEDAEDMNNDDDADDDNYQNNDTNDDSTPSFGRAVMRHWQARASKIEHPYSITAWALCVIEDVREDVVKRGTLVSNGGGH